MNSLRSLTWNIPLLLCLVCLLAFGGCQRQGAAAVTGEPSEFTDPISSEDTLPEPESTVESSAPPSSEETPVSSQAEPVSSQQESEKPVSQDASSSSQASSQVFPPAIPFTVGAIDQMRGLALRPDGSFCGNTFGAIVIRSAAEYREQFDPANFPTPSNADTVSVYHSKFCDYLSKYNETFFEENALIYMITYHPQSSSLNDFIHSISRSGSQLTIEYTTAVVENLQPGEVEVITDDCGGRKTLIEVKQSDVKGITEIVPQQSGHDSQPEWWF